MEPSFYIPIVLLFLVIFLTERRNREAAWKQTVLKKRKKQRNGENAMQELAKKMLDKECMIYTLSGSQLVGTVREVSDGAMLIDNGKETEVVNLDFVVRIREYPKNKNGKKKSVVLD